MNSTSKANTGYSHHHSFNSRLISLSVTAHGVAFISPTLRIHIKSTFPIKRQASRRVRLVKMKASAIYRAQNDRVSPTLQSVKENNTKSGNNGGRTAKDTIMLRAELRRFVLRCYKTDTSKLERPQQSCYSFSLQVGCLLRVSSVFGLLRFCC